MPAITLDMTEYAYSQSILVTQGKLTRTEAVDKIVTYSGMNEGSAKDYVVGIGKILSGELYKRTFNTEATDYILTRIRQDYSTSVYDKALNAIELHIDYYESLRHGRLNSIRSILDKHRTAVTLKSNHIYPDELDENLRLIEGLKKTISVNAYERNGTARRQCIEHYGTICNICQFDFEAVYGNVGSGFIHVHHIVPLHVIDQSYKVDPISDLRPVCPNCHAMLHRGSTTLSIEELRNIMNKKMSDTYSNS